MLLAVTVQCEHDTGVDMVIKMTNLNEHTFHLLEQLKHHLSDESIDDLLLWVECESYEQEIDRIVYETTIDNNNQKIGHIRFQFKEIKGDKR